MSHLSVLTYGSNPFLDIYGLYSDKGMAFDFIIDNLLDIKNNGGILYLGDSENDNADNLPDFIRHLAEDGFVFSEDLLTYGK